MKTIALTLGTSVLLGTAGLIWSAAPVMDLCPNRFAGIENLKWTFVDPSDYGTSEPGYSLDDWAFDEARIRTLLSGAVVLVYLAGMFAYIFTHWKMSKPANQSLQTDGRTAGPRRFV